MEALAATVAGVAARTLVLNGDFYRWEGRRRQRLRRAHMTSTVMFAVGAAGSEGADSPGDSPRSPRGTSSGQTASDQDQDPDQYQAQI